MKLAAVLACLAIIVGCSSSCVKREGPPTVTGRQWVSNPSDAEIMPDVVPVYIDAEFTLDQKASIIFAVNDWNWTLNGYRQYVIEDVSFRYEQSVLRRVVDTGQGLIVAIADGKDWSNVPENALAWVDDLGDPVVHVVVDRLGSRDLKTIMMHEMGHTLGVGHAGIRRSLMAGSYPDQPNCIDRLTVQMLASTRYGRFYHWSFNHMNYCVPEGQ
jgi:hypothetical protein